MTTVFVNKAALQTAISEWIADPDAATETYGGAIGTWNVGAIADFSDLFFNASTLHIKNTVIIYLSKRCSMLTFYIIF